MLDVLWEIWGRKAASCSRCAISMPKGVAYLVLVYEAWTDHTLLSLKEESKSNISTCSTLGCFWQRICAENMPKNDKMKEINAAVLKAYKLVPGQHPKTNS